MLRLLILIFLIYFLYRLLKGLLTQGRKPEEPDERGIINEMVQDPYCKTYIPMRDAKKRVIDGQTYFFCSDECATQFEKEKKKQNL